MYHFELYYGPKLKPFTNKRYFPNRWKKFTLTRHNIGLVGRGLHDKVVTDASGKPRGRYKTSQWWSATHPNWAAAVGVGTSESPTCNLHTREFLRVRFCCTKKGGGDSFIIFKISNCMCASCTNLPLSKNSNKALPWRNDELTCILTWLIKLYTLHQICTSSFFKKEEEKCLLMVLC